MSEKRGKADRRRTSQEIERAAGSPPHQPRAEIELTATAQQTINSPLIPPEWIAAYEQYIPNAGERLMKIVETEQRNTWLLRLRAQRTASLMGLGSLAVGGYLAYLGLTAPAIAAIFAPVSAIIVAMFRQRKDQ